MLPKIYKQIIHINVFVRQKTLTGFDFQLNLCQFLHHAQMLLRLYEHAQETVSENFNVLRIDRACRNCLSGSRLNCKATNIRSVICGNLVSEEE